MALTVELAGFPIGIEAAPGAGSALTYCAAYFTGFTTDREPVASVTIIRADQRFPASPSARQLLEHRLTASRLRQRVGSVFVPREDTFGAGCRAGCLAYHPADRSAQLFLGGRSADMYAPLYRLMWMFFAQALGELGCFFIHAAAVAAEGNGFLFLGDSGEGKSTVAANVRDGAVLSDDGPIVCRRAGGGFEVFASPYHQFPDGTARRQRFRRNGTPIAAVFLLDREGKQANSQLAPPRAVPLILQRFIHFWDYLSPAARMAAFDLFHEACHTFCVRYLTVPQGANALELVD